MTVDLIWLPQHVYSVPENKDTHWKEICSSFNSRGSACHNQLRNDFQDFFFNGGAPAFLSISEPSCDYLRVTPLLHVSWMLQPQI
jgi:hypothetical protein